VFFPVPCCSQLLYLSILMLVATVRASSFVPAALLPPLSIVACTSLLLAFFDKWNAEIEPTFTVHLLFLRYRYCGSRLTNQLGTHPRCPSHVARSQCW